MSLMSWKNPFFLFIFVCFSLCFAEEPQFFQAEVNTDKINIRSDSTVSSLVICQVDKGEILEVVLERYEWLKVRLPKSASVFVKKNLVSIPGKNNAKVIKDRVNIRLKPNEASPVVGRVNSGETITVLEEAGEWYKIEPAPSCFGWINKRFATKAKIHFPIKLPAEAMSAKPGNKEKLFVVEGVIEPYGMIIKRVATHKITTKNQETYLLRADKKMLNQFNRKMVLVSGKLVRDLKKKYQIIEVEKVELLN